MNLSLIRGFNYGFVFGMVFEIAIMAWVRPVTNKEFVNVGLITCACCVVYIMFSIMCVKCCQYTCYVTKVEDDEQQQQLLPQKSVDVDV